MPDDAVLRRVRALLDRAEGTTFEAERDACLAKAQELMVRHAIDEALVDRARGAADPVARTVEYATTRGYVSLRRDLLARLAEANRCRAAFHPNREGGVQRAVLVGYPVDLDWVEMLYTSLLLQLMAAAERAWSSPGPHRATTRRSFLTSFGHGFVAQVAERLRAVTRTAERAAADTRPGTQLVLRDRSAEVDRHFVELFPRTRSLRANVHWSVEGEQAGREAGRRADLGAPGRTLRTDRPGLPGTGPAPAGG